MSRTMVIRTILLIASVVAGFGVLLSSSFAQDSDMTASTSTVHRFADHSEVEDGFARLTRYDNGVTMAISTNDLNPGDVYTIWWVVFNAPENCTDGVCNEDDILVVENGIVPRDADGNRLMNMDGIANANISVQHAGGGYSVDGTLNTSASLGEGEVPGIVVGPGLLDAETAEIHLVIRTHGPAVEEYLADQISTFGGGCEPFDALPCEDVQFAIFQPPA